MKGKGITDILVGLSDRTDDDNVQKLTKGHQAKAIQFYKQFHQNFLQSIEADLKQIQNALNVELGRTIRKLENKLRGSYANSLAKSINTFYLEPYVSEEVKEVYKSVGKLKQKAYLYINQFCDSVLKQNLDKAKDISLYHYSNNIRALDQNWKSVTSRCPMNMAEVTVKGFNRPQTTWVALGVSKKMKEYGPINKGLEKQDFMGNVYLNGSHDLNGQYRMKKDLNEGDVFVVECMNRMVWVYRKKQGKNKKQAFIMEDNKDYYIYLAIKGPIELTFSGAQ